jgi:MoaD family protein
MARVKVKTFSVIRDVLGADVVELEVESPATVGSVFDALLLKYGTALKEKIWDPEAGEMAPFLLRLNDEIIRSKFDGDRSIQDGDEIAIIFPIGGG